MAELAARHAHPHQSAGVASEKSPSTSLNLGKCTALKVAETSTLNVDDQILITEEPPLHPKKRRLKLQPDIPPVLTAVDTESSPDTGNSGQTTAGIFSPTDTNGSEDVAIFSNGMVKAKCLPGPSGSHSHSHRTNSPEAEDSMPATDHKKKVARGISVKSSEGTGRTQGGKASKCPDTFPRSTKALDEHCRSVKGLEDCGKPLKGSEDFAGDKSKSTVRRKQAMCDQLSQQLKDLEHDKACMQEEIESVKMSITQLMERNHYLKCQVSLKLTRDVDLEVSRHHLALHPSLPPYPCLPHGAIPPYPTHWPAGAIMNQDPGQMAAMAAAAAFFNGAGRWGGLTAGRNHRDELTAMSSVFQFPPFVHPAAMAATMNIPANHPMAPGMHHHPQSPFHHMWHHLPPQSMADPRLQSFPPPPFSDMHYSHLRMNSSESASVPSGSADVSGPSTSLPAQKHVSAFSPTKPLFKPTPTRRGVFTAPEVLRPEPKRVAAPGSPQSTMAPPAATASIASLRSMLPEVSAEGMHSAQKPETASNPYPALSFFGRFAEPGQDLLRPGREQSELVKAAAAAAAAAAVVTSNPLIPFLPTSAMDAQCPPPPQFSPRMGPPLPFAVMEQIVAGQSLAASGLRSGPSTGDGGTVDWQSRSTSSQMSAAAQARKRRREVTRGRLTSKNAAANAIGVGGRGTLKRKTENE